MNRLESIKERLKVITHDYVDGQLTDDIEYLLQRLEIAQKALEDISSLYSLFDDESTGMKGTADEALDQLKE